MISPDGIWLVQFEGRFGQGMAMLVLSRGTVTGAGARGGLWDGSYRLDEATGDLDLTLTVRLAKGLLGAVAGLIGGALEQGQTCRFSIPAGATEHRLPSLPTPLGPLSAVMRRLRALP